MQRIIQSRISRWSRIVGPAVGGLALFVAGAAATAAPGPDGQRGSGGKLASVCAKIECTADQKVELQALMGELRDDSKSDRAAIKELHAALAREWVKETPDEDAMTAIHAKIEGHKAALAGIMHDTMMEVHAMLEPGQRAKLVKLIEERGFGFHGGPGKPQRKGKSKAE